MNCSSDREKFLKFEAEDQEFAKFLRSLITRTVISKILQILGLQPRISKVFPRSLEFFFLTVGQNNFGNKIPFLTYSLRFFRFQRLGQFEFKLEKNNWDLETCRKILFTLAFYYLTFRRHSQVQHTKYDVICPKKLPNTR